MKNTISKILVLLIVLVMAFACLASCDTHQHQYVDGKCSCGLTDPNYVPPHIHNFVEGKCSCGEKDPDYVPPHTHDYKSEETKAPTCTEKGQMTYTCECGEGYTEKIDANGHSYVDGLCSVCGQKDPSIPVIVVLSLEADKTQATSGATVTLTAKLNGEALEGATYTIIEGANIANISGNVLTVKDNAVDGNVIRVKTVYQGVEAIVSITIIPNTHVDDIIVNKYTDKIAKGSTIALIATVSPAGIAQNFLQWEIVGGTGKEYASIIGSSLSVSENAETGTTVKVQAHFGNEYSEVLTLTIVDPSIFALSLDTDKAQQTPGGTVTLSALLNGMVIDGATYTIIEGAGLATIEGNVLTISADAVDGDVIRVKTQHQGVDSNVVTITVIPSTHVDSIFAEVDSASQNVMKGSTVALKATVNPDGIAASFIQWKITEGADIATISGNSLTISDKAETGAKIKVVAYFGEVESNELEITVAATQEEINAGRYFLTVSNNEILVDKFGASAPTIKVNVLNYNFESVTLDLDYAIVDGDASLLTLTPNGNLCTLTANGHGTVTVRVSIPNTNVSADIKVDVIVPPTAITLPEVFAERSFDYSFSLRDSLPFAVGIKGTNVCQDYEITFTHRETGKSGDEVAIYEDGKITFKQIGKITVSIQSTAGSRNEAKASYTFDINDGYNVYSHEELHYLGEGSSYNGDKPINIVVLEKPVDPDGNYNYGYSIVPAVALLPDSEQSVDSIIKGVVHESVIDRVTGKEVKNVRIYARVQFVNKGVWLNGNEHSIDASQIRLINKAEYTEWYSKLSNEQKSSYRQDSIDISSLFSVETWAANEYKYNDDGSIKEVIPGHLTEKGKKLSKTTFRVRLYNMEVKGNAPIDHNPGLITKENPNGLGFGKSGGGTYIGLSVGTYNYNTHYDLEADNLTVSETELGIWFMGIVGNSTISNLHAYNCYSTGLTLKSCIITLENLKFGVCGATAIELSPEECNEAGEDDKQTQRVTIKGTIDVEGNLNAGNTNYFQNYSIMGATVPQIIQGNLAMYPDIWVTHLRNNNGQFNFVSFIFNDFDYILQHADPDSAFHNKSYVSYPAYQEGGIIDIMQLPQDGSKNTTHQFITMPVYADIPGLGTVQVGTAMFYNMNYGK